MIRISLITPTRNRPQDLTNVLNSLMEMTTHRETIEVLLAVDKCDPVMLPLIKSFEEEYRAINVKFFIVDRSDHISKDYFNFLSLKAQGRWVMCINDDSIFMTKGWDVLVNDKMLLASNRYGDDILLGIVNDGMIREGDLKVKPDMSCWVLSSKEYINLMDGLLIEEIYNWGGDYWIGRLFKKVAGGQRKVYIQEVLIEHNSHHANPRRKIQLPQPESFQHFMRIENAHPCQFNEALLRGKVNKINEYIKSR